MFLEPEGPVGAEPLTYEPGILGRARVRFASAKGRVDVVREIHTLAPATDQLGESAWEGAREFAEAPEYAAAPADGGFAALPGALASPRAYPTLATALKGHLARTARLGLFVAPSIDAVSLPGESEGEFRIRVSQRVKEWRDRELDRLRDKHAAKLASLNDRILRARQKVEKEKAEAKSRSMQTYVSIGTAVLTALLGRKVATSSTVGRAATSMRSASRAARQQADVAHAEESLSELEEKLVALETSIADELEEVRLRADPDSLQLEPLEVVPKKTDVSVEEVVLAWVPAGEGRS